MREISRGLGFSFVSHSRRRPGGCQLHNIAERHSFCKLFDWQNSRCIFHFAAARFLEVEIWKETLLRFSQGGLYKTTDTFSRVITVPIFVVKEYGTSGKLCRDNAAEATEAHEIQTADKSRGDFLSNYTMSVPPFVCLTRTDLSSFEVSYTYTILVYIHARRYIHMHT